MNSVLIPGSKVSMRVSTDTVAKSQKSLGGEGTDSTVTVPTLKLSGSSTQV